MTSAVRFAVDIGNSGMRVVALPDDPRGDLPAPMRINWLGGVKSPHSEQRQFAAEDPEWPERLLRLLGRPTSSQWWISSVNRSATATLLGRLRQLPGCTIELVDYRRIPLWLEVDQPSQVGIDRLLAAWAASQRCAQAPSRDPGWFGGDRRFGGRPIAPCASATPARSVFGRRDSARRADGSAIARAGRGSSAGVGGS